MFDSKLNSDMTTKVYIDTKLGTHVRVHLVDGVAVARQSSRPCQSRCRWHAGESPNCVTVTSD